LGKIEVELENALLAHRGFEHPRDYRLLALAQPRTLAREEQVLRQLLADGRGARQHPALLLVLLDRLGDRLPVEAVVADELCVLRRNHRALELRRDALVIRPAVREFRLRVPPAQLFHTRLHERGAGRIEQPPPEDMRVEPGLHRDYGDDERAQAVAEDLPGAARDAKHAAAPGRHQPRRSAASTGAVSGRTPRQSRNDSAACSTSMPAPSRASAPAARAMARNGVSRPYTMS